MSVPTLKQIAFEALQRSQYHELDAVYLNIDADVLYRAGPPRHPLTYKLDDDFDHNQDLFLANRQKGISCFIYIAGLLRILKNFVIAKMGPFWERASVRYHLRPSDFEYHASQVWYAFSVGNLHDCCPFVSVVPTAGIDSHYHIVCETDTDKNDAREALETVPCESIGSMFLVLNNFEKKDFHPDANPRPPPSPGPSRDAQASDASPSVNPPTSGSTPSSSSAQLSTSQSSVAPRDDDYREREACSLDRETYSTILFADMLIVRALISYSVFLLNDEIPELQQEGEHDLVSKRWGVVAHCHVLAGTSLITRGVNDAFIRRDANLLVVVARACAHYATSDDPWIVADPAGQAQLLAIASTYQDTLEVLSAAGTEKV